jgi:putative ABC transport system permease protein
VLAGGEIALALPLLVGAVLLIASLIKLQAVAPGFNPANVLTVDLFLATPNSTEPAASRARNLIEPALQRIRALPGVVAAGVVNVLPVSGGPSTDFVIEGRAGAADEPSADVVIADAGYFGALQIPLRRGRLLRDDDSPGRPRVIVVSEAFVRRYSPNDDLLGRRMTMLDWGPPITAEIVGVMGDVRTHGLNVAAPPMVYWSYQQFPSAFNMLVVRTRGNPADLAPAVKRAVWDVDPNQPVTRAASLESLLATTLARRRFTMVLLTSFAALAMTLAAIGMYGVMGYAVARRRAELGIRLALGASPSQLFRLTLRDGCAIAAGGAVVGLAATVALTRTLQTLVFDISPMNPLVLAGGVVACLAVSALASAGPARRAAASDPLSAIRAD